MIHNIIGEIEAAAKKSAAASNVGAGNIEGLWKHLGGIQKHKNLFDLIEAARSHRWAGAIPVQEPYNGNWLTSSKPVDLVGVDGSQVYPSAFAHVQWAYVQVLAYKIGTPPNSVVRNRFFDIDDLMPDGITMAPYALVDAWRSLLELKTVLAAHQHYNNDVILLDGPLLPFLKADGSEFQDEIGRIKDEYIRNLVSLKGSLVAGVVSRPQSRLVLNLLHLADSKDPKAPPKKSGVRDIHLMRYGLQDGARSALFKHSSPRNDDLDASDVGIYFFFMRVGREIMRVEIPQWVANDQEMVGLIHTSILKGCVESYPYVLACADQQVRVTNEVADSLRQRAEAMYLQFGGKINAVSAKQAFKGRPLY